MGKAPDRESIQLSGPAGGLEALLESPPDSTVRGAAVILHPHPLHGGTMHNKVAHTLARSFVQLGLAALRFNFRGTGKSAGEYDKGDGELEDAIVAVEWMRGRYPGQPLWLGGFSFGAAIAIRAAVEVSPDGLVCVAPAVSRFAGGLQKQPGCPWLILQGDQDELVAIEETVNWVNGLDPGPELVVFDGVEHFFHGKLIDLRESVTEFVGRHAG